LKREQQKQEELQQQAKKETEKNYSQSEILLLYRHLLKAWIRLKYTDQAVYHRLIRTQFEKHKHKPVNGLYYKRGKWLLENNLGGLM